MKKGIHGTHTTLLERGQSSTLYDMSWLYPHDAQQGARTYGPMKNGIWHANEREGKAPSLGSAPTQHKLRT